MGQAFGSRPDISQSERVLLCAPVFDALLATRTDRLVWGTNWPHPHLQAHMPDDGDLLDLFNNWVPDAGARQAILAANPARLYDFAAPD